MLGTLANATTPVVQRRRLICLALDHGWADKEIAAALTVSRATAYREIKAVRDARARGHERRAS